VSQGGSGCFVRSVDGIMIGTLIDACTISRALLVRVINCGVSDLVKGPARGSRTKIPARQDMAISKS
jgi:hypothetical protein